MKKLLLLLLCVPLISFSQNISVKNVPEKYSLMPYSPTPIYQGETSLCAAYALSNMRTIIYNINKDITNKSVIDSNRFSPFFLYYMVMGSSPKNKRFTDGLRKITLRKKNMIGALDFMQKYGIAQRKNVEGDSLFYDKKRILCYPNDQYDMFQDLNNAMNYKIDSFSRVKIGESSKVKSKTMREDIVCNYWQELSVSQNFFQKIFSIKRNKKNKRVKKRCHRNNGNRNKVNCKYHNIGRKGNRDDKFEENIYTTRITTSDISYIKYLIRNQNPLYIGFKLPSNFYQSDSVVDMGGVVTCGPGHAMVIIGYDDSKKAFQIMNSWKQWGDGEGFSWLKYQDLKRLYGLSVYQLFAEDKVDQDDNIQEIKPIECNLNCKFLRIQCTLCDKSPNKNQNFLNSEYSIPTYKFLNSSSSKRCFLYKNKR
jgi:hypothetical protein